jgi:hypothetical protein
MSRKILEPFREMDVAELLGVEEDDGGGGGTVGPDWTRRDEVELDRREEEDEPSPPPRRPLRGDAGVPFVFRLPSAMRDRRRVPGGVINGFTRSSLDGGGGGGGESGGGGGGGSVGGCG